MPSVSALECPLGHSDHKRCNRHCPLIMWSRPHVDKNPKYACAIAVIAANTNPAYWEPKQYEVDSIGELYATD